MQLIFLNQSNWESLFIDFLDEKEKSRTDDYWKLKFQAYIWDLEIDNLIYEYVTVIDTVMIPDIGLIN